MEKDIRMKDRNRLYLENVLMIIVAFFLSSLFGVNSPLHPWIGGPVETDSGVFKTMALVMEHGYMPYRDSFDHKGPLLYILNWIGNRISQYRGIWLIEVLFLSICVFMIYKIARIECGILPSLITTLLSMSLLFSYFEGGNFTEEYALPFITITLFISIDYLKNNKIGRGRLLIAGVCLGAVLLLRPNMISVWLVFGVTILVSKIVADEKKELVDYVFFFLIGVISVVIPIIIWLAVNGCFTNFIYDYIVFNMNYVSSEEEISLGTARVLSFWHFFDSIIFMISFFSSLFYLVKDRSIIHVSVFIYIVISLLFVAMSGRIYGHYGMTLIPVIVYPISLIWHDIERLSDKRMSEIIIYVLCILALSTMIMPEWIQTMSSVCVAYEEREESSIGNTLTNISNIIDKRTEEFETVSVYGNWDIVYVLSNRMHATTYSYQFPIGEVNSEILDDYYEQLQKELPQVIVIQAGRYDDRIKYFLDANSYQLTFSNNGDDMLNSDTVFVREEK